VNALAGRPADASPVPEIDPLVAAAVAGDRLAFDELVERHRSEVVGHCWRMLRSADRAEDATQETFLRAWRARDRFAGRASFRTWLHQIATNTCLDELRRIQRRAGPGAGDAASADPGAIPAPAEEAPETRALARETAELAVLVTFALLNPRQRAVLVLRDVLRWSAADTAGVLGTSVPSVNSTLQRARARLDERRPSREDARPAGRRLAPGDRARAERCVEALARADWAGVVDSLVRTAAAGADAARVDTRAWRRVGSNGGARSAC
jgi:RNA polymerase sigma-70 factor (ECF subfamily)